MCTMKHIHAVIVYICCIVIKFVYITYVHRITRVGLLRPGHHCRNCGYWVCTSCSSKAWPSNMVPATYHDQEVFVRVCDSCQVRA